MTTAHEPRRGPGTHLSADDLSALAEGAQPSAVGAAEHVLECAACRSEVDAMSELLAQFEEWDTPAIPQEVAIRIDAALARESAARAETAGHPAAAASASSHQATAPSGATVRPRRRRRFPARGLGWALAALVVAAGGLGLLLRLGVSGSESGTAASGAAAQPDAGRYNPNPNSLGPNATVNGQAGGESASGSAAQLTLWTKQVLAARGSSAALGSPCLSNPAFADRHELAVANGSYDGVVATLVVYANPAKVSTVLAVVYAVPCTTKNYRVLTESVVAE